MIIENLPWKKLISISQNVGFKKKKRISVQTVKKISQISKVKINCFLSSHS